MNFKSLTLRDFRKGSLVRVIADVEVIVKAISYSCCLLFLYSAANKLMEYDKFFLQMSKSPVVTDFASIFVWMIPTLEIVISIMLCFESFRLLGLYAVLALMSLFTAYIYTLLNFSDTVPCS